MKNTIENLIIGGMQWAIAGTTVTVVVNGLYMVLKYVH